MMPQTNRLEKELSIAIGKPVSVSTCNDVIEGVLVKVIDDKFILMGCIDGLAFVNLANVEVIKVGDGREQEKNPVENYLG